MTITDDMVKKFNNLLSGFNCSFKLELSEDINNNNNPIYRIVPTNNFLVESAIINPSREFYVLLEDFFGKYEIALRYNSTKTMFWSKYGWDEKK